jgi:drug/metabolite transporter (DMT)-like permease
VTAKGRAEWLLFATTFIWGGTFVIIKEGLADLSPLMMVSVRFTLATLILLPFCMKTLFRADRKSILWGLLLGFLIFAGFFLQTLGLKETTTSKSAFITTMMVIFTPLFQLILLKRRPKWGNLVGVILVSIGLWFLTAPSGGGLNRGDLLTLLCAIVFGLFIVLLDWTTRRYDFLLMTFLQIVTPAICGWILLPFVEQPLFRPTQAALFALGYTAILATVVTGYIQTRYQRDTTPTRAALIFAVEPVWAAILGFLFLQESLGRWGMFGGGLIIGGILFSELSETMMAEGHRLFRSILKIESR